MRQRRIQLVAAVAVVSIATVVATTAVAGNGNDDAEARLSGLEEVPVISTEGSGKFKAKIRSDRIEYTLSYRDLEGGGVLAAHIHLGQRTANGGIAAFLCGGGGKDPCPPSPATVRGTIVPADVIGPTNQGIPAGGFDELVDRIGDGVTYANVHTMQFTGGEVRGQIDGDGGGD
jgi:CHRD domain